MTAQKKLVYFKSLVLMLLLVPTKTSDAKVSSVVVFGDSSVDTGNNNHVLTIAKANFPPYGRDFPGGKPTGRFSNGRLTSEFISEAFGVKKIIPAYLDPRYSIKDFATGVSFASAGSGYDNATSDVLSVIPLWKEVEYYKEYQQRLREYLGDKKANEVIAEALYVTSMGTNDFIENYYSQQRRRLQFTIDEYKDFVTGLAENFVRKLYDLGARKFSLGGLPPMGCLPYERTVNILHGHACNTEYNNVARDFNSRLHGLLVRLNQELPGIRLKLSDPYHILEDIVQRPSFYGFKVADRGCYAIGKIDVGFICDKNPACTCHDADKFVFWDTIHPSQKTNKIVANYIVHKYLFEFL